MRLNLKQNKGKGRFVKSPVPGYGKVQVDDMPRLETISELFARLLNPELFNAVDSVNDLLGIPAVDEVELRKQQRIREIEDELKFLRAS